MSDIAKRLDKEYVRIALFELTKNVFDTQNQEYWRDYFLTGNAHPSAPDYIKKASSVIQYANLSEEERRVASVAEKLEEIDLAEKAYVFCEGKAEGRLEEKFEIAKNMQKNGVSPKIICKCTGLTPKELKSLMKKQKKAS